MNSGAPLACSAFLVFGLYILKDSLNFNWIFYSIGGVVLLFIIFSMLFKVFREQIISAITSLVITILAIYGANTYF